MKLETKFSLADSVYFMCEGKVAYGYIDGYHIEAGKTSAEYKPYLQERYRVVPHQSGVFQEKFYTKEPDDLYTCRNDLLKHITKHLDEKNT